MSHPKLTIVVIFFLSLNSILAQDSFALKISPFNVILLDETRTILPIGLDYKFNKFAFEFEIGLKTGFTKPNNFTDNEKGFRARLGVNYYFFDRKKFKMFTGLSYYTFPQSYIVKNSYYYEDGVGFFNFSSTEVEVKNSTFHLLYGFKVPLGPKFLFELIAGGGIKYLDVNHKNTVGMRSGSGGLGGGWFTFDFFNRPYSLERGVYSTLSLIFNLRFGYYIFGDK